MHCRVGTHSFSEALALRSQLRQNIVAGNVETAELRLYDDCRSVVINPMIHYALKDSSPPTAESISIDEGTEQDLQLAAGLHVGCQKFIELIRRGKLDKAVAFGQEVSTHAPAIYILKGSINMGHFVTWSSIKLGHLPFCGANCLLPHIDILSALCHKLLLFPSN